MNTVDPASVKALRDMTGVGLADCKKALSEKGNIEDAIKYLREKGIASAAKKADRETHEGACCITSEKHRATILKLACETDFVARNEKFHAIINSITSDLHSKSINSIEEAKENTKDLISEQISIVGENMSIAGLGSVSIKSGVISSYIHTSYADNIGKKACIIGLESDSTNESELNEIGKKICMHIVAMRPEFVSISEISEEFKFAEKEIYKAQMSDMKKPQEIIDKIIEGKLSKTMSEKTLLDQDFCIDPSIKVKDFISVAEKSLSAKISLTNFVFFEI